MLAKAFQCRVAVLKVRGPTVKGAHPPIFIYRPDSSPDHLFAHRLNRARIAAAIVILTAP